MPPRLRTHRGRGRGGKVTSRAGTVIVGHGMPEGPMTDKLRMVRDPNAGTSRTTDDRAAVSHGAPLPSYENTHFKRFRQLRQYRTN